MTLCVVFWYHALVGKLSLFPATVTDMLYYWFTISGHLLNICHALSFVMNNKLDSTLLCPLYTHVDYTGSTHCVSCVYARAVKLN